MVTNKNQSSAFSCLNPFFLKQAFQTSFSPFYLNVQNSYSYKTRPTLARKQDLRLWGRKAFLESKNGLSGEIFKENLQDVFYTNLEQSSFSLTFAKLIPLLIPFGQSKKQNSVGKVITPHFDKNPSINRWRLTDKAERNKNVLGLDPTVDIAKRVHKTDQESESQTSFGLAKPNQPFRQRTHTQKTRLSQKKEQDRLTKSLQALFAKNGALAMNKSIKIGDYIRCGDKIGETSLQTGEQKQAKQKQEKKIAILFGASGKVVKISKTQVTLQKTQPILFYSQADLNVKKSEWIKRGTPVLTLTHETLVTGDIVQGIPRIEQLFEAFTSPSTGLKDSVLHDTLHSQVRDIFRKNWLTNPLPIAVRQSLEEIQQILVESIQKVYLSQGVLIADKHIEIVVRQMTSKVQILDSGSTGLLLEEIVPIRQVENTNITTPGKKALYAPAVVGLTSAALSSDSFISAASFQETTRVLSRDAVVGKSDFLRGLKEKVVIGDLLSAGTGLDIYFVYTLLPNSVSFVNKLK